MALIYLICAEDGARSRQWLLPAIQLFLAQAEASSFDMTLRSHLHQVLPHHCKILCALEALHVMHVLDSGQHFDMMSITGPLLLQGCFKLALKY